MGPAQSSENNRFPSGTSSLKDLILSQAPTLIGIGALLGVILLWAFLSEFEMAGPDGVFGEEGWGRSVKGEL